MEKEKSINILKENIQLERNFIMTSLDTIKTPSQLTVFARILEHLQKILQTIENDETKCDISVSSDSFEWMKIREVLQEAGIDSIDFNFLI